MIIFSPTNFLFIYLPSSEILEFGLLDSERFFIAARSFPRKRESGIALRKKKLPDP
jgi:hypothetical protein